MKNVSGYDLHKLLIGSLGTLAVITRANFKTFPMPPEQVCVCWRRLAMHGRRWNFVRLFGRSPLGRDASGCDFARSRADFSNGCGGGNRVTREALVRGRFGGGKRERRGTAAARITSNSRTKRKLADLVALGDTMESMRVAAALLGRVCEFPAWRWRRCAAAIFRIAALPSAMDAVAQRLEHWRRNTQCQQRWFCVRTD